MDFNIKIFLFCPIPEDQKPMTEYILLKENFFFNWISLPKKQYRKKLLNFFFFFPVIFSLSFSFFLPSSFYIFFFLFSFFFFSLFLRWFQIKKNFLLSRFFYEETSWYDGQIWEKPFLLIKNERLLISQKVDPIIQRLFRLIVLFFLFSSCLFFSRFFLH